MLASKVAKRSIVGSRSYFDWAKHQSNIFTKWTSKDAKDNTARLAANINKNYALGRALPEEIEPIDWNYWNSVIKTPGVVAEAKKKFEEIKSRKIGTGGGDVEGLPADFEQTVEKVLSQARRNAEYSREQIKKLEPQLATAEKGAKNFSSWNLNDYYRSFPGTQKEIMEDYDHGVYDAPRGEFRRKDLDLKPYLKSIKDGDLNASFAELPDTVGDFDLNQEKEAIDKEIQQRGGTVEKAPAKADAGHGHGAPKEVAKH